jgi:hypothetical protein
MQRRLTASTVIKIAGCMLGVILVAGLISVVNASCRVGGSTGVLPLGWVVAILAAVIIGALAWLLLDGGDARSESRPGEESRCLGCNRAVLPQWRMCPYCGCMLDREGPGAGTGSQPVSAD